MHSLPTSEENHEIIEKFGWRGNLIQSYCRRCRNGKHSENKKGGFFSSFSLRGKKKKVECTFCGKIVNTEMELEIHQENVGCGKN